MKLSVCFLISLFFVFSASAARRPLSLTSDYISRLDQDTVEPMRELVLMSPPPELRASVGTEKVFTKDLQKQFRDNWRDQFGFSYSQEFLNNPVDVNFYGNTRGYSKEEQDFRNRRRSFGEYVAKKTVEYHVDNYFKTDPQLKAVYEVKEKFSNLDVKVDESTKILTNYDFAGNHITTNLESPYVHARLRVELAGNTTIGVSKGLSPTVHSEFFYKFNDMQYTAIGKKRLTDKIETSLTVQRTERETNDRPRESMFIVGISLLN